MRDAGRGRSNRRRDLGINQSDPDFGSHHGDGHSQAIELGSDGGWQVSELRRDSGFVATRGWHSKVGIRAENFSLVQRVKLLKMIL